MGHLKLKKEKSYIKEIKQEYKNLILIIVIILLLIIRYKR